MPRRFPLFLCSFCWFAILGTATCSSNKTAQNATSLGNNSTNANDTNSIAETINNTLARNENIHEITQRLLAGKGVSKLSRPYVGVKPLKIKVNMFLVSVGEFRESDMEFKIEMYFRQYWRDPRLAHGVPNETITISGFEADNFWQPDTYFENEKTAVYHVMTSKNKYIRIYEDGQLFTSTRITLSIACPMGFRRYPMDYQTCELHFGSYGFTTKDLIYEWHENKFAVSNDTEDVAQFAIPNIETLNKTATYATGSRPTSKAMEANWPSFLTRSFSILYIRFQFARRIGHYFIRIYIPAILIVMISWLSFYIDKNSAPARVSLGITTVLTMTTLLVGVGQGSLPVVSYVKAVDWYLIVCYMMVFSAFVEYAFVTTGKGKGKPSGASPRTSALANNSYSSNAEEAQNETLPGSRPDSYVLTISEVPRDWKATRPSRSYHLKDPVSRSCNKRGHKRKTWLCRGNDTDSKESVSVVDKWSRRIFPSIFFIFNFVYWLYYLEIDVSG